MAESHESSVQPIKDISDEILLHIFRLLKLDDILKISCVSRRFNRLAHDQSLHKKVNFGRSGENLFLSLKILHSYVTKHASWIHSFVLIDCYWISACQMGSVLKLCRNLTELNVIGCELTLQALALIASRNPNLNVLGWSIPSKMKELELYGLNGTPTSLNNQLGIFFGRLSSLRLRFRLLENFKTVIGLFPRDMTLSEFSIEYNGAKSTSIIHDGSNCNIHLKTNIPFSMYYGDQLQTPENVSFYFNVLLMDFATKIALNAAKTEELTNLLAPGSFNIVAMNQIASSCHSPLLSAISLNCTHLNAERINWLGHLTRLTCIDLQHVKNFKANLMKAVAINNPNLVLLNLNNCADWVDADLCALETLCSSCLMLRHLNVGGICCHSYRKKEGKCICKIVSRIKHLRSLSISPCSLAGQVPESASSSKNDGHLNKAIVKQSKLAAEEPSRSQDKRTLDQNMSLNSTRSKTSESSGYITRQSAQQKEFIAKVIQNGSGVDDLVEGLNEIEDLELIGVRYSSAFSIPLDMNIVSFVCPNTRNLLDVSLLPLKSWKNLKSLSLAGLHGLGSFNSLIEITKSCMNLEQLSLASIGLPGNALALASLPEALRHCHHLKKLRVDQPYYSRTEKLLKSLQHCGHIESVLIACKSGKIPKDLQSYIDIFEQCKRLCVFQLFSGAPGNLCRVLTKELTKRLIKQRPPLSITMLHFSQSLTENGLQSIPFAHLKSLTCFESKIAVLT